MSLMMLVCCCFSVAQSCPTLCNPVDCSTLGFPVLHHLLEFAKICVRWFRNAIQPSELLSSILLLPWVFPSIRIFSSELALRIRWPNYWSFSISHSQLMFRVDFLWIDWFDLLTVQGTLKSLLQHHSSKVLILQHSPFFIIQLSHPYMTAGKMIALTIRTFVGKLMSLPFSTLSRFVLAFLPRSKSLLISWLQTPSTVILEPQKIKSTTVSIVSPSFCLEVMGPDAMIFVFWMLSFKPVFSLSSFIFIKRLFL